MNSTETTKDYLDGTLFTKMVFRGASELRSNADEVNSLNVFPVPDGDTGDNMRMTLESGLAALENINSNDLAEVMKALSHGMLLGARGNSGVILSQFFAGIAKGLDTYCKADAAILGKALTMGVEQAYASVMTPKEGTILTVAREATEYAVSNLTPRSTTRSLFSDLLKEMQRSLIRTPDMLPILKEAGVIDSGGAGLFHIMNGFNRVLNGDDDTIPDFSEFKPESSPAANLDLDAFGPESELTYGYCTEFLLRLQSSKVDLNSFDHNIIKNYLGEVGDSVVAFRTDSIIKVHVHTRTPEKVLEFCHRFGEFLTLKIENMSIQHSEVGQNTSVKNEHDKKTPRKIYGIVAVCSGEGIKNTFLELGADVVIDGGQTQNPSTGDFLTAFEQLNAEHILVFPNNSNIIMAAKQAADIYKDANVHVVETVDIGGCYAALPAIDESEPNAELTLERMSEMIANVAEGQITTSIRDTSLNGCHISKGDTIGIYKKKVTVSTPSRIDAACSLLRTMLEDGDRYTLTVFWGAESTEEERTEIESFVAESFPDVEIFMVSGMQQIYPYIFITE